MSIVKIQFSIEINAPCQRVWDVMFDPDTYREWTSAFSPSSYFEGSWSEGSRIRFLGVDERGNLGGFSSRVVTNQPYRLVAIEHLAVVENGVEVTAPSEWTGAREDYHFAEKDGVTSVRIEQDIVADYADMFKTLWPKALAKVKALAEQHS